MYVIFSLSVILFVSIKRIKFLFFILFNTYPIAHRLGIEAVAAFTKGTTSEKPETIAAQ